MADKIQSRKNENGRPVHTIRSDRIKKQILQYLELSEFGVNISQIAEELKFSRNTVTKYLDILQDDGTVYCQEMGPSKIWFSENNRERLPNARMPDFLRAFIIEAFNSLERSISMTENELNALFQQMGRDVGKKVPWPTDIFFPIQELDTSNFTMPEIKKLVEGFLSLIKDSSYFLKAEIVPIKNDENSPILIRATFHEESWGQFKQYYNLMAGYFESKLRMAYGERIYLAVNEIQPDGLWAYYEIGITDESNPERD